LDLAKIGKGTPNPEGGSIEKDYKTGEPTGIFIGFPALKLIGDVRPKPSYEDLVEALKLADKKLLAEGITSAMDAAVGVSDLPRQIAAYQEAIDTEILHVRHNLAILSDALINYDDFEVEIKNVEWKLLGMGIRTGLGDAKLRIGPLKIIPDGALSTGTAATYDPYGVDPENQTRGVMMVDPEKLIKLASVAHKLGWQLAIHGIGDRALDAVINAIENALKQNKISDARHRIEHCIMVSSQMIKKIKELNIIVIPQPGFIWEMGDNYISQIGKEKAASTIPLRTFLDNDIKTAFGSDRPVINGAPLIGIHAAVNQKTMNGQDYAPLQKISVEEALQCYTLYGAYASFEENIKGSIETGKLADLAILSDDITNISPEKIVDTKVMMTMVDGKFVCE
jgi:predicted amidohydrolase YtcJ